MKEYKLEKVRIDRLFAYLMIVSLFLGASGPFVKVKAAETGLPGNQVIVFTTIFPPTVSFFSEMSTIYTEAFGRIGYTFKLICQPGERAMIDANQGAVDGEAARIMNIDRGKYPNLIRVPYPILTMKDGAYAIDGSIKIDGWKSLESKPYTVGLLKGIKSVEQRLQRYIDETHIVTLSDVEQCLKMLMAKRIDVFIAGTQIEDSVFMRSGAYNEVKCVGIVESKVLYPWLHKRHQDLVQPLADTLRKMKSEGRL